MHQYSVYRQNKVCNVRKKKKMCGGWLLCGGTLKRKGRTHPEEKNISEPKYSLGCCEPSAEKKEKMKNKSGVRGAEGEGVGNHMETVMHGDPRAAAPGDGIFFSSG